MNADALESTFFSSSWLGHAIPYGRWDSVERTTPNEPNRIRIYRQTNKKLETKQNKMNEKQKSINSNARAIQMYLNPIERHIYILFNFFVNRI